ncbi:MAG: hypothetical protein WC777_03860 [Candidatus Gracilibacteria bacterium]|jgi:hypothetical protein
MLTDPKKMIAFTKAGGIEEIMEILGIEYAFEVEVKMMRSPEYKAFATKKALLRLSTVPIRLPIYLLQKHTKKTILAILMATQLDGCQHALHLPTEVDYIDFFNKQGDLDLKVGPAAWDVELDQSQGE